MVPIADQNLILIGLGANLPSSAGSPRQTLEAALDHLAAQGVRVTRRSRFWRTRPVPISDQPWFVNAVAAVETNLSAAALLDLLHATEAAFGRMRTVVNAARVLDLDLLAYGTQVMDDQPRPLVPHPRMSGRAFVLLPLRDIAPGWVHPVSGESLEAMIAVLEDDQYCIAEDERGQV
ncbi:2-amino-4-hydroxy-6-hydroxymethyldihydropteridine diphosphokinase [Telmatospirillum siberiense]|uniref:2-amino-4-hydroxy-6-hydroxymethyldihydropteridine pyrophosphokinase n=1 Tax=Telmatospirillum siberiense TaxID=382514 RepID=A0A2N3PRR7_9PROT|nr:2-amino-4-hydroxy-6-hydroxymethyldihydropteridine diphosphokinase [Telmatospirillum siberiense]PKU23097.1 2-amino-4-hydroxy-6-hydroxymethyldihydropteridine diphosphokinase [Telmatospirillum siberiense]